MKLASLDLFRYSLPLAAPLPLAGKTLQRREGILLRMRGDGGEEGWGEASPLPGFSRENLEEVAEQLRDAGKDLAGREVTGGWLDQNGGFARGSGVLSPAPSARFGLDLALWNLLSSAGGKLLPEMTPGQPTKTLWLSGLLSGSTEEILNEARRMRESGYRSVKLKVGGRTVEEDAELVSAVVQTLGESAMLRLDANRAWSFEEAEEFARATADSRYEYIEEPLAEPGVLSRFARETDVPVALDESLVGMEAEELGVHAYAQAVVLKPTLLGGISRTLRLAERARSLGVTPVVSSAYESGVGTLGLLALAATIGNAPAGLDTYRRLAEDVISPGLDLRAGVNVPETIGLRREVDPGSLEPAG